MAIQIATTPSSGEPTASIVATPAVSVPLPHDLPPYGHLELTVLPASLIDANDPTELEVLGVFHQAPCELIPADKASLRVERTSRVVAERPLMTRDGLDP